MKKTIAILLAALMALTTLLCAPALADTTIVNADGLELRVLKCSITDIGGETSVTLHTRVINNKSLKLWVGFDASTIDGVEADDSGRSIEANSDTGDNDPKYYTFSCHTSVSNPTTLKTTLIVQDYDAYDELYREELTIDLTSLPKGEAPVETPKPTVSPSTDTPTDYSGSGNTAPAYTPASYDFKTLQQGSKGQAVRDLQQRLTDLGYLCDKIDGSYGRNTNTAVRSFCDQNGLPICNQATPEMQQLLYSSSAQYYEEPYIPLVIGATFQKKTPLQVNYGGSAGQMTIQLVNRSSTRGIRGYVIYYYQTDMYGNKINLAEDGTLYEIWYDELNPIEPAHYKDALSYVIPKYYGTYAVYVGIQKIVFDDGEIRELDLDDVDFYECVIAD